MHRPLRHITVIGGGLSGLTAAYRLAQRSPYKRVTLLERSERLGGWIDSTRHAVRIQAGDAASEGDVLLEGGPRTIRPRGSRGAPKMLKLIDDLGLRDRILPISKTHPAATSRFLLDADPARGRSLVRLPSSLASILGPQHPLLRGLLLAGATEPFRARHPRAPGQLQDESVHSFFSRRFGERIATNLASAMVHGIYAADSRQLSVRSAFPSLWDAEAARGSVLLGSMFGGGGSKSEAEKRDWDMLDPEYRKEAESWSIYGLQGGLEGLVEALKQAFLKAGGEIMTGADVEGISLPDRDGDIQIATPSGTLPTSHVVSALPLPSLSTIFPSLLARSPLGRTPYTSVGVVNLVLPLPPDRVHPAGFGYLVPRSPPAQNPHGILGVIFDSTALAAVDSASVRDRVTKVTVMMGGPWWSTYRQDGASGKVPTKAEELVEPAMNHLREVFHALCNVEPLVAVPRLHRDCIPTYQLGHGDALRELHTHLTGQSPWAGRVSLVGNAFGGVGVNDCVLSAEDVVEGLVSGSRPTGLERWAEWR